MEGCGNGGGNKKKGKGGGEEEDNPVWEGDREKDGWSLENTNPPPF